MISQSGIRQFLTDLFEQYRVDGVDYCLLRNYETLPERLDSSDVDIMIASTAKEKNRQIVKSLAVKHRAVIYNHYVDERFDQYYLYRRVSPDEIFVLKLDFFSDTELYGVCLFSAREILSTKVPYRDFFVAGDVWKVLDKWLFIYLLNARLPTKYHAEFRDIFIRNKESMKQAIARIVGNKAGDNLCARICANGFDDLPRVGKGTLFLILLKTALKSPLYHAWHVPCFFYYRIKYSFFPQGEFVSVSGPDGCGKTTVMEQAKQQLEMVFRSSAENHGHFRPTLFPRIAEIAKTAGVVATVDEDYASPHRGKVSGFFGSLFRFCYYLSDYVWGYFFKIRPVLVRRELVVYDRYYFDMLADPGRSRISLPLWMRKAALLFVPLPDTPFFVHVPTNVVHQRKQELTVEKIADLNDAYLKLAQSGRMQILQNSDTAEVAAAKLVDTVIERRRCRLKLDRLQP